MLNNSFKIGDSNNNLGTNSTILGGSGNYIAFGADSVSLQGCTGVVVNGDVRNFTGVNLVNRTIDSTFSNSSILGKNKSKVLRVTESFTIDGLYDVYEIDLDSIGVAITCTWSVATYPIQVEFKIVSNAGSYAFTIDDNNSPVTTIDGFPLPYPTGMATNDAMTVYSNGSTLKIATRTVSGVGASTFLALTDTPASYAGQAGKEATVNGAETALEFTTASGGGTWGSITGTISSKTDLMTLISLRL
jgi:hypothetical protein